MAGYFLKRGSHVHGPVDSVKVVELARKGKVKPTDEVSTSKDGPWRTAAGFSVLKEAFASSTVTGHWFANISGFAGDQIQGPLESKQVKELIDEGRANVRTQLMHPTETNNEWMPLRNTDFIKHVEQRKNEKREKRRTAKLEKKAAKLKKQQANQETDEDANNAEQKRLLAATSHATLILACWKCKAKTLVAKYCTSCGMGSQNRYEKERLWEYKDAAGGGKGWFCSRCSNGFTSVTCGQCGQENATINVKRKTYFGTQ